MRMLHRSLLGLFLMVITFGLLAAAGLQFSQAFKERSAAGGRPNFARERQFAVNVTEIVPQTLAPELTLFGEIESRSSLVVRAPSAGRVIDVAVNYEEGGRPMQGDMLLQLDPKDALAAVRLSQADVSEAVASLEDAKRALEIAKDDLAASQEQLALRTAALERQENLLARGVGSASSVEAAAVTEASAKQAVLTKRQALANAQTALDRAETSVLRAEIDLEEQQRALDELTIRADFDGVLSEVTVVLGALVGTNEQVATLIDPDALEVSFRLSTEQYARLLNESGVLPDLNVEVSLDVAGLEISALGQVSRESAIVGDGQTGRLLFARLDNAPNLRPGDFVRVTVVEPEIENVALVPASAVDASNTVLALDDQSRLSEVSVEVVRRQADDVLISAAELAGLRVVSERSPLLGAGILVRVNGEAPEESAAPNRPEGRPNGAEGGRPSGAADGTSEETVELSDADRHKLLTFVKQNNRMPEEARARLLEQLEKPEVPVSIVNRLQQRMGG